MGWGYKDRPEIGPGLPPNRFESRVQVPPSQRERPRRDIDAVEAGKIFGPGGDRGINISGEVPADWDTYIDLTADGTDLFIKNAGLELTAAGALTLPAGSIQVGGNITFTAAAQISMPHSTSLISVGASGGPKILIQSDDVIGFDSSLDEVGRLFFSTDFFLTTPSTSGFHIVVQPDADIRLFAGAEIRLISNSIDAVAQVVSVGADDSGGAGYRLLRVPN